jgi:hypothetical protein
MNVHDDRERDFFTRRIALAREHHAACLKRGASRLRRKWDCFPKNLHKREPRIKGGWARSEAAARPSARPEAAFHRI